MSFTSISYTWNIVGGDNGAGIPFYGSGSTVDHVTQITFNDDNTCNFVSTMGLPAQGTWANNAYGNTIMFTVNGVDQSTPTPWVTVCAVMLIGNTLLGASCQGVNALPNLPGNLMNFFLTPVTS